MGKISIVNITMDDLKAYNHQQTYADNYIFMADRIENVLLGYKSAKIGAFLVIFCAEGEISLELDNKPYHMRANDILVALPNVIVSNVMASLDHKVKLTCYSWRFLEGIIQNDKSLWEAIERVRLNPLYHYNDEDIALDNHYYAIIDGKLKKDMNEYEKIILRNLTTAIFYEMVNSNKVEPTDNTPLDAMKQADNIFGRFVDMLAADNGRHRTVKYYAQQLCYTPKYLSMIVKQASGKKALTLINENALEHIIAELKLTDKSVKQIAYDFDFPNNSFFTRFFYKHTGMTPTEFRNQQAYQ